MISNPTIQGAYINVALSDRKFFKELVQKMGWEAQTREELLDSFIESRPEKPSLSDEEIMNEVRAVRYSLWNLISLVSTNELNNSIILRICFDFSKFLSIFIFKNFILPENVAVAMNFLHEGLFWPILRGYKKRRKSLYLETSS